MLVLLAVSWSVSLERMKIVYTGLVLTRQLALATRSGWHGICVIRIACYTRRVVNSAGEFVWRAGGPFRLMKWLSGALLSSCPESFNCRWNYSSIPIRTGLFVDSGSWDLYGFRGGRGCVASYASLVFLLEEKSLMQCRCEGWSGLTGQGVF